MAGAQWGQKAAGRLPTRLTSPGPEEQTLHSRSPVSPRQAHGGPISAPPVEPIRQDPDWAGP